MEFNPATAALQPSGIREIMHIAARREGVVRLDIGDPDFPTPPHVIEAARLAPSGYAPSRGIAPLRQAAARKVSERGRHGVCTDEVVVTQSATQGIFAALLALARPGDEVLIPDPSWPNYLMMCEALRLRAVPYPLDSVDGFTPTYEALRGSISSRTRVLLLNSPANPTGSVIPGDQLQDLLDLASRNDLWVISDECYEELADKAFCSAGTYDRDGRVITVHTLSKTYAMSGWRVGYVVAPGQTAGVMGMCQESMLACVSEPAQHAALAALEGPQEQVRDMRATYRIRLAAALDGLRNAPIDAARPEGTFYVWADISRTGMKAHEFASLLLDEHDVAVAPGSAFGSAGANHVRLALTTATDEIAEGAERIADFARACCV